MIGSVGTNERGENMRRDLGNLEEWAVKWQMSFNAGKCKVMGMGFGNKNLIYSINGKTVTRVEVERVLGIIIGANLKA